MELVQRLLSTQQAVDLALYGLFDEVLPNRHRYRFDDEGHVWVVVGRRPLAEDREALDIHRHRRNYSYMLPHYQCINLRAPNGHAEPKRAWSAGDKIASKLLLLRADEQEFIKHTGRFQNPWNPQFGRGY